jgi:NAD(P)-dependent dehydrogenase (short-subunit alcohol dehydrogenase family)
MHPSFADDSVHPARRRKIFGMMWIDPEEEVLQPMDKPNSEKIIVATGATSGIGLAAAKQLARAGVGVIGIGRSEERCRAAEASLRGLHPSGKAHFLRADLSLLSEVRAAAEQIRGILKGSGRTELDGLLNNAGGVAFRQTQTPEGFDRTWALNHLAPFLLTHEMLPLLRASPWARVVTVSSGSHYGARLDWQDLQSRGRYSFFQAYGRSKLANVLFTLELNRRLGEAGGVQAFAADPGLVNTGIGTKGTPFWMGWVWRIWSAHGKTPGESAKGIVRLLLDPSVQTDAGIYWKYGLPVAADPAALNAESARRLWEISEQMCGIAPSSILPRLA